MGKTFIDLVLNTSYVIKTSREHWGSTAAQPIEPETSV